MICMQGLDILLAIMGEKLRGLGIYGQTGLLDDFNFSSLWVIPNLQRLSLQDVTISFDQEAFEKGIACLRCAREHMQLLN